MIVESHSPPAPGGYGGDGGELTEGEVLDRCIGDLLVISDPEFKVRRAAGGERSEHWSLPRAKRALG